MKGWGNDDDPYWKTSGPSFNLGDEGRKYKFDEVNKFSMRSAKPAPAAVNVSNTKSYQNVEPLSFSIKAESDLECPELKCHACQLIIVNPDTCKYEGNKVFTNEICWRHWIDKMIENGEISIDQLCSLASKQYYLGRVSSTCNGQLIIKVTLALRGAMQPFEFGSLMYDNKVAYNHYLSFLKETKQSDDKLLRCNNQIEEAMSKLLELVTDNNSVGDGTVQQYIRQLIEFRNERLVSLNIPLQCEMIKEYISLLEWQQANNKEFINAPLIETLMSNNVSYKAIKDIAKAKYLKDTFKLTAEEFVWTSIKSIAEEKKVSEIDSVFNHKVMGSRADVPFQRVVAYLVFLDNKPDEIKMKCLSKISDIQDLVECANMWKLLPAYLDYCKSNKDSSQIKKIQQIMQNSKR